MAFIPEESIQEIRDRAGIVSVLSQYIPLKKSGVNFKACCPFHSEKTPSFVVSEAKQIYHCFGCGKGGNVFTFLMDYAGLTFPESLEKLADQYGVKLPEKGMRGQSQSITKESKTLYYKINKAALSYFRGELKKHKVAHAFLKQRGVTPETASKFHIGFVPDQWDGLAHFFSSKKVSTEPLVKLGLILKRESKSGHYDRFRGRIIFPLFDLNQRVLGFGGRVIDDKNQPKYLNSSDSPIYNKRKGLYGLSSVVREGRADVDAMGIIVVEGYFDVVLLWQAGFKNVVATMGTALTEDHVRLLKRYTNTFVLMFDGDEPGQMAAERSLPLFLKVGGEAQVVVIPDNQDPDDFIRAHSAEALKKRIMSGKPLLEFALSRMLNRQKGGAAAKAEILTEVARNLENMDAGVVRENVIRRVADTLQISEKWVYQALEGKKKGDQEQVTHLSEEIRKEHITAEVEIIEFFMLFPEWRKEAQAQKILDLFGDLELKTIGLEMIGQSIPSMLDKIESGSLRGRLMRGVLEKEQQNQPEDKWRSVYDDCVKRLHRNRLERVEHRLISEIKKCENEPSLEEHKVSLLAQYQKITKEKQQYR